MPASLPAVGSAADDDPVLGRRTRTPWHTRQRRQPWTHRHPTVGQVGHAVDQVAAIKDALAGGVPLQRMGTSREIATTVAFLLSGEASYITGENIVVGGGAGLRV
ncbi:SDR family oxidoreductase [Mycolicibacterium hodleri]|uniref:SDR family oxidoreductase n=1 Tax=Mycolicibacterium hodleri TaxID=49897 RepID=UPI003D161C1E